MSHPPGTLDALPTRLPDDGTAPAPATQRDPVSAVTWARILALVALVTLMARISWLSDDALITLRTALNLTHGWGPGFNATESVAAYTHPLWFALWVAGGALTGEWLVSILVLSLGCAAAATGLLLWRIDRVPVVVAAAAALGMSNAFMEYSTSGLENPLSYLWLGLLVISTPQLMSPHATTGSVARAGAIAAALALTRLDVLLIVGPVAVYLLWIHRSRARVLAAGALTFAAPLALWFLISALVYGSPLPNTYPAKRNLDIPQLELVVQGFRYLGVTAERDPATLVVLGGGLLLALAVGGALVRLWATGILLYVAYVVWIGGDFMVGRFLAVPVYATVLILVEADRSGRLRALRSRRVDPAWAVLAGIAVSIMILAAADRVPTSVANPAAERWSFEEAGGVADERGWYVARGRGYPTWLMTLGAPVASLPEPMPSEVNGSAPMRDLDAAIRSWPMHQPGQPRLTQPRAVGVTCGGLGAFALLTGPEVHWIDPCGLTDRFLAMQPFHGKGFTWRVGHYARDIPAGYEDAVRTADPAAVRDPAQRQELQDLWGVIR